MIAQRMKHSAKVEILDESGAPVRHTPESIHGLFEEELARLLRENTKGEEAAATLKQAAAMSEEMILRREFNPA
jgi:hypothetical protein